MKRAQITMSVVTGLAVGLTVLPALAQERMGDSAVPEAKTLAPGVQVKIRPGRADQTLPAVDESALRYFASRGDKERVDAEIARLRAEHPGWEPPADLFGEVSGVDEAPLWALYEQGDYGKVREEIAKLGREHPDWAPPKKLLALMEENEIRKRLQGLESEEAWRLILEVADDYPGQIACSRIDNMWRVAKAHAELGEVAEAAKVYARIVRDCPSLDHRIATLQKAQGHLEKADLDRLFEIEAARNKTPDEAKRVAAVRKEQQTDQTPAVIQAVFRKGATLADARRAKAQILEARHAAGAEQLGWLHRSAGDHGTALVWFRRAQSWSPSAKRAEGLALTYAALGRYDEASELAKRYPAPLQQFVDEFETQRITRAYESKDYRTVLEESDGPVDPGVLTLRGWTLLELERPTEAAQTFARVVDDDEVKPSQRRKAAFGLARAEMALGRLIEAEAIGRTYRLPLEQRHEIHAEVLQRRAYRAFQREDWRTAIALLEARRSYAEPDRNLLMQEGWVRYHLGHKTAAKRIFETLHRVYATPQTEEALRVVSAGIDRFGS